MKFRFCGDLDCPDWILAEINTLAKLSSVKMKIFCQLIAATACGEQLNEEKAKKIIVDSKLEGQSLEACVAAVHTILTSAASFSVQSVVLCSELEQLGLPKEHAQALTRVYTENASKITQHLKSQTLRLSKLESAVCKVEDGNCHLKLGILDCLKDSVIQHQLCLPPHQLANLLAELKSATQVMDG